MKRVRLIAVSLAIVAVLLGGLGGCAWPEIGIAPSPTPTAPPPVSGPPINPTYTPPPAATTAPALPSIADVVALVKPSVVAITTEVSTYDIFMRPYTEKGAGSGWIIDRAGLIVTNNHVVEGAKTVTVTLDDGRTFAAGMIRTDPTDDLAVLKIEATNLPALRTGDSARMRVGDWVVAIGNALGQGISAKEGIVSRKGMSISVNSGENLYNLIETSAAINPGNSGGPLVNLAGEVIGITSAKLSAVGIEGMGYAIGINEALPIIESLIQKGTVSRPYLGVSATTVNPFLTTTYKLAVDKGAFVEVVARSPAAQAGLNTGDVIVNFGGKAVATAEDLVQAIRASQIGQSVEIVYWRGKEQRTARATLVEKQP